MNKVLEVQNLQTAIQTEQGIIYPVNNINFEVMKGEILAIVGESGSGKSLTALSIIALNSAAITYSVNSKVIYDYRNLLIESPRYIRTIRGNRIAMIFQDPMFSLNPVKKIGKQIAEVLYIHENLSKAAATKRVLALLEQVGIPNPQERMMAFPHELSGGMRQRIMIAMALACNPDILIADEPTTALDVTIQAQILSLLKKIQKERHLSIIFITHDLGVVAEVADRVLVMYCGKIVEKATVFKLFANPKHPYTEGLLSCIPTVESDPTIQLEAIPGAVPNFHELENNCAFHTRCKYAMEECRLYEPKIRQFDDETEVACWNPIDK
ncbi:ABC transporter ATP-binding protein [Kurthia sibirica]|uniref:Peptide ABC transporter ATP-binding protein n=1 Tax=Kurthia sibirica TaxID=202750 RepID=A0A2U3ALM2_9BACL|nr:ABC transporter ATP-binding protein [Kurthia sibirica]PWI25435.1 peptide ABC transporter ATP-binding protein [Kurthia sibirica]GEK34330.1 ABC transporter ATP-binding protein [Kurthia sibirica]